jgi:hypothetical protein
MVPGANRDDRADTLGRPERWIGPLLVAFAVLEFAVAR